MAQAFLNSLPRLAASEVPIDRDQECFICTFPYDNQDKVPVQLPCSHIFSLDCLEYWFVHERKNSCPYCRTVPRGHPDSNDDSQPSTQAVESAQLGASTGQDAHLDELMHTAGQEILGLLIGPPAEVPEDMSPYPVVYARCLSVLARLRAALPPGDQRREDSVRAWERIVDLYGSYVLRDPMSVFSIRV